MRRERVAFELLSFPEVVKNDLKIRIDHPDNKGGAYQLQVYEINSCQLVFNSIGVLEISGVMGTPSQPRASGCNQPIRCGNVVSLALRFATKVMYF